MATTINMLKCTACGQDWVAEDDMFCPPCAKKIRTDLLVHELERACNGLEELPDEELKRHEEALDIVSVKVMGLLFRLK